MSNWKKNRKILLCITGGIAAYKIPFLVRLLKKQDCEIEIMMTKSAEKFVTPMTLSTLSGKRVWLEEDFMSNEHGFEIPHIKIPEWAEIIVIAPCSADMISKISQGICDNLISAALLAKKSPVVIFPAMNERMFENPATQENLKILEKREIKIISPSIGALACGDYGKGRLPEPEEIFYEIFRSLCPIHDMKNKKVLVTLGPTHEYLDPVRYISNPSTGKMGAAMARSAWYRGAEVKIISGPVKFDSYGFEVEHVISADEMLKSVMNNLEWADFIVKAAAVGDYKAEKIQEKKIKREGKNEISLTLVQNPDIALEVGKKKKDGQILIGFAAETDDLIKNAKEKLKRKNLDYILANDILAKDSGFASDNNTLRLISKKENVPEKIFSGIKEDAAFQIWDFVLR